KDGHYEHISDAFKLSIQYLGRLNDVSEAVIEERPVYFSGLGVFNGDNRKRDTRIFQLYLDRG
ncbi:MAG: hypothetical protein QW303_09300, partial [Nitrososphaerota archaeon]